MNWIYSAGFACICFAAFACQPTACAPILVGAIAVAQELLEGWRLKTNVAIPQHPPIACARFLIPHSSLLNAHRSLSNVDYKFFFSGVVNG